MKYQWYNDGIDNKRVPIKEEPQEGWIKGYLRKDGRFMYEKIMWEHKQKVALVDMRARQEKEKLQAKLQERLKKFGIKEEG